jgi:hypothetical protein
MTFNWKNKSGLIFLILSVMIFLTHCSLDVKDNAVVVNGEGPLVSKVIPLDSIEAIVHEGGGITRISRGPEQKVTIRAQQNVLKYISASVDTYVFTWGFTNNIELGPTTDSIIIDVQVTRNIRSIKLSGAGIITAQGPRQKSLQLELYGSGYLQCYDLPVDNCDIFLPGIGDCQVSVSDTLSGMLSGHGNIYYKGSPFVNCPVTGSGNIIKINN